MVSVGLLGFDGGRRCSMVDECLWVPHARGEYGLVETAHVLVADVVTSCLIDDVPAPGERSG